MNTEKIWENLAESIRIEKDGTTIPVPVEDIRRLIDAREKALGEATVTPTAHEVTTDERDRIEQSNSISGIILAEAAKMGVFVTRRVRFGIADALWSAGYRFRRSEPQGEPSDAQVDAALLRFNERRDETWWDAMRAALRAAWESR